MLAREVLAWVYRGGERVLGRAVFAAKCSLITRYPTDDNYYGPGYLWTLFGDPALRIKYAPLTGVGEVKSEEWRVKNTASSIIGSVLFLPASVPSMHHSLFSASGRKVASLVPGPNDVCRLPSGVYFLGSGAKVVVR